MEIFIPGLLLFFVALLVSFLIVPRFTPLIIAILSLALLTYGVYDHYKLFAAEYRLSTWQESLKVYAPAVMLGFVILFIIYSILAVSTGGAIPVPPIPNIPTPNENSITGSIVNSLNKIGNTITNNKNTNVVNSINEQINNVNKNRNNLGGLNNQNKGNNNGVSRSFLETI
jgi:hypothetical protein